MLISRPFLGACFLIASISLLVVLKPLDIFSFTKFFWGPFLAFLGPSPSLTYCIDTQDTTEGVTKMANGELPPGTVVVGVHMPLRNLHLCQVTTLDQDLRPVGNGMVFRKGWPYTKVLDYYFKQVF